MDKERPPDLGNRELDTSSTDDKIPAFEEVADSFRARIQPAVFLTHLFLQKHPILLEERCLTVDWDRIPGLYCRTDKLLMVSVTDKQWEKWGWPGGWTAWEPDSRPDNFIPNMAMVVCKGAFHDAPDSKMQTKVGHFITIVRVPECIHLLPFDQLREAFNNYDGAATTIGLVRLHRANALFPDVYFEHYGEHFTIMGLSDPEIHFGTADEFVGGYLVHRHVATSNWKAHAMLPPEYVLGAKHPWPSPTYPYWPCDTGTPGEHPPVHVVYMATLGTVLPSPQRFCIAEAPAAEWPFGDAAVPWILPKGYRNPDETVWDFPDDDNQAEGPSGSAPVGGPTATTKDDKEDNDDDGFETVDDGEKEEETPGDKVVLKISMKDIAKPEGSGLTRIDCLFDDDTEEEDDPELRRQIAAAHDAVDPIDELKLSESSSDSGSESSDADDDNADPNVTRQYLQDQEAEEMEKSGTKPEGSNPAATADPPAVLDNSGNPGGPGPGVPPERDMTAEATATKGKGPNSEKSGKAPAPKLSFSTSAEGVREHAQSILFGAATLAQAMGSEEDVTHRLENYTGLLDGLQNLVGTMAGGYEDATQDIRTLVASTLDAATKRDRTFVAGASQALAEWTTTYQQAMSQGENQSIADQLARWDRVRAAGIALSRQVTSLTAEHNQSTASGEIFRTLIPACFERVRLRTEATFSELNASLPSLLCRFVTPDQAGHILASLFTCMCNYNMEMCGMAMVQTVVPVYTIPNTYRVQQSLWESLCQIIPGIARTSGTELRSAQLPVPNNTPVEPPSATSGASDSGVPGATAIGVGSQPALASQSSRKKRTSQEKQRSEIPLGIPPARSTWVCSSEFQNLPAILVDDDNPPDARPQDTSTPIKATLVTGRHLSGGKNNKSKVDTAHLIWKMEDRQETARKRAEAESQAAARDLTSCGGRGSGGSLLHGLPVTLPNLLGETGIPVKPSNPAPEAPKQGTKRPHDDDDDEITELPAGDDPAKPPKKKKKKKSKDKSLEEVPHPGVPDDGARPSSSTAEPEVEAVEPTPAAVPSGIPEEETEPPKKKKKKKKDKKDPQLEKFREQEREAKAKEMAKVVHRRLQRELDFRAVRDYRKGIPEGLLNSINGTDHSRFLLEKLDKEGNYMSKKNGYRRNLMTVKRLLARIAKHADEPDKRLKEAQAFIKSTFPLVQGMVTKDKSSPTLVVRVLVDCFGKEQNIGLHDVISPAAMARVTAMETYIVDEIPTMVRVDLAYCPFCSYTASHHRALNNHVRMHLRAIMVCGWLGCYFVHMHALRMIEHSAKVHGMVRAKPASDKDKGGD